MRSSAIITLLLCNVILAEQLNDHPTIKLMLAKNNELRQDMKMVAHIPSEKLTKAAQDHALYMAKMHDKNEEDFNHDGNNGLPGERAARYGFSGIVKENIGRGYQSINKVFEAWETSKSHRVTIYSDMIEVGFGYAISKDGTTYWVALYGKPKTPHQN